MNSRCRCYWYTYNISPAALTLRNEQMTVRINERANVVNKNEKRKQNTTEQQQQQQYNYQISIP